MSRTPELVRTAARAIRFMEAGDITDLEDYLRRQIRPDGGFRGRAADSDLYYTLFGGACLAALKRPPPTAPVRRYLESFGDGAQLDFVHSASLARCWAAMPYPFSSRRARKLLPRLEAYRSADGGYHAATPGAAHGTVYGAFLAFLAYAETGGGMPRPEALRDSLEALRAGDGGYANAAEMPGGTTTVTAAAMLLRKWLELAGDPRAAAALRDCECPAGGFLASTRAPGPDLLSTATALHALRAADLPPARIEPHLDFVESLWDDNGGFRGHPADPLTDCEYAFYALLALGSLYEG